MFLPTTILMISKVLEPSLFLWLKIVQEKYAYPNMTQHVVLL